MTPDGTATQQECRAERLVALKEFFDGGGTGSTFALARRFGVSPRTMNRDLLTLDVLFVPLLRERVPSGTHRYSRLDVKGGAS